MGRVFFGILLGIVLLPAALLGWLKYGDVPVAVADPPFPQEQLLTHMPLNARIERELVKTPPIQVDEANLEAGAAVYRDQCAVCHGFHGKPSRFAAHMFPDAPPLWEKHPNSAVIGVSDDPTGETYWKVANGIRLTGMPAYKGVLTEIKMWQVSLLLANADKPLPPAALEILRGEPKAAGPEANPETKK
jgi:mono/diheme cytochrome c family protein